MNTNKDITELERVVSIIPEYQKGRLALAHEMKERIEAYARAKVDPAEFIADLYFCKSQMMPIAPPHRNLIKLIEELTK